MINTLLPTTVVGSYPQPDWLVNRDLLLSQMPPRVRLSGVWRVAPEFLAQAQDDATVIAVRDMERAGIDIVTDGEIRRESYSNRFATALDGIDLDTPAKVPNRTGTGFNLVPRVVGPIRRLRPVEVPDAQFLRRNTDRPIKMTMPGPFTMAQQCHNEYYRDEAELAWDYAVAVNAELKDLKAAGTDVVQLDEPWMQARPEKAAQFGLKAVNRALQDIPGPTALHLCFGYAHVVHQKPSGYSFLSQLRDSIVHQVSVEAAQPHLDLVELAPLEGKTIILGVIDLGTKAVETAEDVAGRVRRALKTVPRERLILAPDCGMKYLSRDAAFGKLCALAAGAALVRRELQ